MADINNKTFQLQISCTVHVLYFDRLSINQYFVLQVVFYKHEVIIDLITFTASSCSHGQYVLVTLGSSVKIAFEEKYFTQCTVTKGLRQPLYPMESFDIIITQSTTKPTRNHLMGLHAPDDIVVRARTGSTPSPLIVTSQLPINIFIQFT